MVYTMPKGVYCSEVQFTWLQVLVSQCLCMYVRIFLRNRFDQKPAILVGVAMCMLRARWRFPSFLPPLPSMAGGFHKHGLTIIYYFSLLYTLCNVYVLLYTSGLTTEVELYGVILNVYIVVWFYA